MESTQNLAKKLPLTKTGFQSFLCQNDWKKNQNYFAIHFSII